MKFKTLKDDVVEHWGLPQISDESLTIFAQTVRIPSLKIPILFKKNCVVYASRNGRIVVYSDGSIIRIIKKNDFEWEFLIDTNTLERRLELGKLCFLSVFGLIEELSGHMRIHCAGIVRNGEMCLFWGAPGSGKSTLTSYVLDQLDLQISSDELILYDGQFVKGVPLKISLKHGKDRLISIPQSRRSCRAQAKKLFLIKAHQNKMSSKTADFFDLLKVAIFLVLGLGLHQMMEFHLSLRNYKIWIKIFFIRIRRTQQLLKQVQVYILHPRTIPPKQ